MLLACRGRQHSAEDLAVSGQDPAEAGVLVSQHVSVGWGEISPSVCSLFSLSFSFKVNHLEIRQPTLR